MQDTGVKIVRLVILVGSRLLVDGPGTERKVLSGTEAWIKDQLPHHLRSTFELLLSSPDCTAIWSSKSGPRVVSAAYRVKPVITPKYCRMKADQAWDCAGLARQDGDLLDSARWTKEARKWEQMYSETAPGQGG